MVKVKTKHSFRVENNVLLWFEPKLLQREINNFDGKEGYILFYLEDIPASKDQYGYFYGAIIKECEESNVFQGMNKREIAKILLHEITAAEKIVVYPDGKKKTIITVDSLSQYTVKEMSVFIEKTLAYLSTELGINVRPAEQYRLNNNIIKK